jgi:photosystem II CP47 chlorophyll apoprotein
MLLYELLVIDGGDAVLNPAWRQGCFVLPFAARLGLPYAASPPLLGALLAHLALAGLLLLAAAWHWCYWDLALFVFGARVLCVAFGRVFGIHLALAGALCFGFGAFHLTTIGAWTSDSFGSFGFTRPLEPSFSLVAAQFLQYGVLVAHHAAAGFVLLAAGAWHAASSPGARLFSAAAAGNVEALLSSSICPFFVGSFTAAASMWYGGSITPPDLYGPTRFSWDAGFFAQEILFRSSLFGWDGLSESVVLLDYVGCNPAKGGLFRSGPMIKGDGVIQAWAGRACFGSERGTAASESLSVRRMPAFFETFPVVLVDGRGLVRAVIPFRRAESRYGAGGARVSFLGGVFSGSLLRRPSLVKTFARKAQLGEIFAFGRGRGTLDGVFRSSTRGWFTYAHSALTLFFVLGHLWHASRSLFRDIWLGVRAAAPEYGFSEKLGA